MNISAAFIRRPVGTTLLAVAVVLLGAIAFKLLPVSPLPQVDFPTINVHANLPGASPDVMAATVATPLERALGRIAGIYGNDLVERAGLDQYHHPVRPVQGHQRCGARSAGRHQFGAAPAAHRHDGQSDLPQIEPGRCTHHDPVADFARACRAASFTMRHRPYWRRRFRSWTASARSTWAAAPCPRCVSTWTWIRSTTWD